MRKWLKNLVCRITTEMGAELKQMGAHGAHEFSAAMFNGSAYVMYPRGHHDDPQVGNVEHEAQRQIEREM
jgi:hypothetical protein